VSLSASVLTPQLTAWKASLDQRLSHLCQGPDSLHHAIQSLLESGSRVRSLLLLSIVEGLGMQASAALEIACALEMAHVYALSHFSLPCQKGTEARPVKTAYQAKWGEGLHLLAGDALLTESFELLSRQEHIPPAVRLQLIARLARAVGPQGMLAGQAASLVLGQAECSSQALWEMHRLKSGALLRCCMEMAALVCHAGHVVVKRLGQTGEELGIALALLEDLAAEEGLLGLGRIVREKRTSTIRTLGIALSRSQALQIIQQAKARVRDELRHPEPALFLLDRLSYRAGEGLDAERAGRT
jgi:geranylgeranyl pyrophosphate synthase